MAALAVPALAVLCVPVAVLLVLFAVDVLRVGDSVTEDDVRFQARPTLQAGLFDDPGFLPGHLAAKAVGLEDDLRYRRAVWLYARANPSNTTVYLSPAAGGAAGEPRAEAHRRQPGGDRSAVGAPGC